MWSEIDRSPQIFNDIIDFVNNNNSIEKLDIVVDGVDFDLHNEKMVSFVNSTEPQGIWNYA